jgi:outer membrane protein assembly factor BamB
MSRFLSHGLFFSFCLFIFACQDKNTLKPHQPYDAALSFTLYPIVFDQMAVLPLKVKENKEGLFGIDIYSGDTLWSYKHKQCKDLYYNLKPTLTSEALVIPFNNGLLCVDRESFRVDFFPLIKEGFIQSQLVSDEEKVIGVQALKDRRRYEVFSFNIKSKEFASLQSFETDTARRLLMRTPQIYNPPGSKSTTFAAPIVDFMPKDTTFSYFLFWTEDGTLDSIPAVAPNTKGVGPTRMPLIKNSLSLWLADSKWIAIDINRKKEVWRRPMAAKMLTSQPLLYGDTLYSAMENMRLYALHVQTGDTLWTQKIAGTPSRVYARDSTLHLIGGSDGKYYRFLRSTGQPIPISKNDAFFARTFYTDNDITIVKFKNQWHIGPSIESILDMH